MPENLFKLLYEEGGIGPGSYYNVILLQLLILYPILQACFDKIPVVTTVVAVILFLIFEVLAGQYIDDKLYRLLCLRYIPFIVAGMNMAKYRDSISKWENSVFALAVISFVWLYLVVYREYEPRILFTRWTTTAAPVVFLAMSIMLVFLYI